MDPDESTTGLYEAAHVSEFNDRAYFKAVSGFQFPQIREYPIGVFRANFGAFRLFYVGIQTFKRSDGISTEVFLSV